MRLAWGAIEVVRAVGDAVGADKMWVPKVVNGARVVIPLAPQPGVVGTAPANFFVTSARRP